MSSSLSAWLPSTILALGLASGSVTFILFRRRAAKLHQERESLSAELRTAMEARDAAEARFRGAFEQAAVGMNHVLPNGRFLRVNQRYCEITGYTREELLGMT